jgi:Obg family GTPase CgtA-like protein
MPGATTRSRWTETPCGRWSKGSASKSQEARSEIQRRLHRLGIGAALKRLGARPGDRVIVAGEEMEWQG